jgi:hypothetical protein
MQQAQNLSPNLLSSSDFALFASLRLKKLLLINVAAVHLRPFPSQSKITAVQDIPKMSSWTKKMPDFPGHLISVK